VSAAAASPPGGAPGRPARRGGGIGGRIGRRRLLIAFGAGLLVVAGLAAALAALAAPSSIKPTCKPFEPCGKPPKLAMPLVNNQVWRSSALGFTLEYSADAWHLSQESPQGVVLTTPDNLATVSVVGARASDFSPQALLEDRLAFFRRNLVGVREDADPEHTLLGTNVGLRPGPGGAFGATLASAQGLATPMAVDVMSAGDRGVSIVATLVFESDIKPQTRFGILQNADEVFKTVEWPSP
jgi:hypothetical protein